MKLNQFGNIGTNTWSVWTSDANHFDAVNAAPIQDRLLFDNFSTALNDNATRGQLSVNMGANGPSLASWSAILSGVVALTNSTPFPQFQPLTNGSLIINPAGLAGTNSPVGQLVNGINTLRSQFKNADGLTGVFEHVGDILAAPQLTEQSPFLNTNNTALGGQQQHMASATRFMNGCRSRRSRCCGFPARRNRRCAMSFTATARRLSPRRTAW